MQGQAITDMDQQDKAGGLDVLADQIQGAFPEIILQKYGNTVKKNNTGSCKSPFIRSVLLQPDRHDRMKKTEKSGC